MTAAALALVGVAVWLGGQPASVRPVAHSGALSVDERSGPRPGRLQVISLVALVCGAVVVVGVARGLVIAAVLGPPVVVMVKRLAAASNRRPDRRRRAVPLTVDLLACVLRAGLPLDAAMAAVAPTADLRTSTELRHVAGLLRLGAEPVAAWHGLIRDPVLGGVAQTARRSAESGIRLAGGLERLARELRAQARTAAHARAQRTAIWAMVPLGLCFLPAFVCLGVVPVVIGLLGGSFAGLR
jgi:Flp pilus assembly protein TadB